MASQSTFRVRIFGCSASDLPAKDRNGFSDPFFQLNFDNFRTARSPVVKKNLNPTWEFSLEFLYETRWLRKLDRKALKIDVYDHDRIGANDFIGGTSVDLHTLATGPQHQSLLLRDGGKPAGRFSFFVEFEMFTEVTVIMKNVVVTDLPVPANADEDEAPDPYMRYFCSGRDRQKIEEAARSKEDLDHTTNPFPDYAGIDYNTYKSSTQLETRNPSWDDTEVLRFRATLRHLVQDDIVIQIRHNRPARKDPVCGTARLHLGKYAHPTREGVLTKFSETVVPEAGSPSPPGHISGILIFKALPVFAQMEGGKHTEVGVEGGKPIMDGVEMPRNIIGDLYDPNAEPEEDEETEAAATPATAAAAVAEKAKEEPPPPQSEPTVSADALPPGWACKKDPKGRPYYVCKYLRTTQWSPPSPAQIAEAELQAEHAAGAAAPAAAPAAELRPEPAAAAPSKDRSALLSSEGVAPKPIAIPSPVNVGGLPTTPGFPKGIEKRVTAKGRVFYANHQLKKNFWTLEAACPGFAEPPATDNAESTPQAQAGLPDGFEKRLDTRSGRAYYVNHRTKTTSWDPPT
uniref:HECT-type E3 ubiquitin transferase n=1 Tax=Sexangularia sp. CB-2014 TaxID=1486929 RepID=A0A6U0K128_9EUKA